MKLMAKGGFSSKLRIECSVESGHEARTHRPSPSSSEYRTLKTYLNTPITQEETSRNKVSILESVLGQTRYSLTKASSLHLEDFTHMNILNYI